MYANAKAFAVSTAAYIKNKVATLAAAAAQGVVRAATMAWKAAQVVLNVVLSANPIGLVIMAIGALVSAVVYAYNNCESFRKIVDKVWEAIKPLATAIMDGLAKAFEWLVEKCKEAWEWLKNILGLGGKKVSVAVDVSKPKGKAPTIDLGETQKKYANAGNTPKVTTPKATTPKAESNAPVWREDAATLEQINENLDVLRARLQKATVEEAAEINQQIALWQAKADAIRKAGLEAESTGEKNYKAFTTSWGAVKGMKGGIAV